MSGRSLRRQALFATAAALSAVGCAGDVASRGQVGETTPPYAAMDMDGDSVRLSELRGQPVLLNVWATWCPPCREEIPVLQALHEELGDSGLRVVGVSIDNAAADDVVRAFRRDFGMTYAIWRDPAERINSTFRLRGVPVTMLIGRDGTVLWRHLGPVAAGDDALREALEAALQDGAAVESRASR